MDGDSCLLCLLPAGATAVTATATGLLLVVVGVVVHGEQGRQC